MQIAIEKSVVTRQSHFAKSSIPPLSGLRRGTYH